MPNRAVERIEAMYDERVKLCYNTSVDMKSIMDETSATMISNMASTMSVSDCYMMPMLLVSTAHHLNGSNIHIWETWEEPSIIFAAVVGYPGTNKSRALTTFRTAIRNVEKEKSIETSRINQGV